MTPPTVDHILLEVKDLDRSIKFYRDRMGLKFEKRSGDFATLQAANVGVYLWTQHWRWSPAPPEGQRPPQGMYPHFAVTDVRALVAKLRQDGVRVVMEPEHHWYGTEAFVADPDGYVWSLISKK